MGESHADTKAQLAVSDLISSTPRQAVFSSQQTSSTSLDAEQRYFVTFRHSSAITPGSGPLFDFLRSRFLPQLIRPSATCHVIDVFSKESMAIAIKTPACMHALLACCGAEIPTKTPRFRNLARFHYTQAVKELRNNLQRENIKSQWMITMHTVIMLCIYEVILQGWPFQHPKKVNSRSPSDTEIKTTRLCRRRGTPQRGGSTNSAWL